MASISQPTDRTPRQLDLPLAIEDVPDIVRDHGLVETHSYPWASQGDPHWFVRRVPTAVAWDRYAELELHSATARTALVLDCDTPPLDYLTVALGSHLRVPNWICSSPNGHAHVVYTLARPVLRTEDARRRPLKLLARIAEFYTEAYAADVGYVGVLTHNPVHSRYRDTTTWLRDQAWTLEELAEPIPRGWRIPKKPATIEGRNCTLFLATMRYFGKRGNQDMGTDIGTVLTWIETAFDEWYAREGNTAGWHRNECLWIAKSVTRYCRENIRHPRMTAKFRGRQAHKGRKSGEVRRRGSIEEAQPWLALEISRRTYFRHQGAAAATITELAPWEKLEISRRTWYYRQKRQGVSDTSSPSSTGGI